MSRYKIGDKVRVKTSLVPDQRYNKLNFASGMSQYRGRVLTIARMLGYEDRFECKEAFIGLPGDDDYYIWIWNDDMVEPYFIAKSKTVSLDSCIHKSDSFFEILSEGD